MSNPGFKQSDSKDAKVKSRIQIALMGHNFLEFSHINFTAQYF